MSGWRNEEWRGGEVTRDRNGVVTLVRNGADCENR